MYNAIGITTRNPALIQAFLETMWAPWWQKVYCTDRRAQINTILKGGDAKCLLADLHKTVVQQTGTLGEIEPMEHGVRFRVDHGWVDMKPLFDGLWELEMHFYEVGSEHDCLQLLAELFVASSKDEEVQIRIQHELGDTWEQYTVKDALKTLVANIDKTWPLAGCIGEG